MNLEKLLDEVDALFKKHNPKRYKYPTYSFSLNRNQWGLWELTVTDDWHKWLDKRLDSKFGLYERPEYAVMAFLQYVKEKKINVKKLCD